MDAEQPVAVVSLCLDFFISSPLTDCAAFSGIDGTCMITTCPVVARISGPRSRCHPCIYNTHPVIDRSGWSTRCIRRAMAWLREQRFGMSSAAASFGRGRPKGCVQLALIPL